MIQPAVKIQVKYKHWILFRDVFEDTQHSGQYSITVLVLMGILRERAHRESRGARASRGSVCTTTVQRAYSTIFLVLSAVFSGELYHKSEKSPTCGRNL
jgi:hypothetical protein